MADPNKLTAFKPGTAPYATWLKTLTPEQYEAHLLERKKRKSMRQAMKEVVEAQQEQWISSFNNAAVTLMKKAIDEGDVNSFVALYDRLIGKPDTQVDVTSKGKAIQAPTIIFTQRELEEWKEENDDNE